MSSFNEHLEALRKDYMALCNQTQNLRQETQKAREELQNLQPQMSMMMEMQVYPLQMELMKMMEVNRRCYAVAAQYVQLLPAEAQASYMAELEKIRQSMDPMQMAAAAAAQNAGMTNPAALFNFRNPMMPPPAVSLSSPRGAAKANGAPSLPPGFPALPPGFPGMAGLPPAALAQLASMQQAAGLMGSLGSLANGMPGLPPGLQGLNVTTPTAPGRASGPPSGARTPLAQRPNSAAHTKKEETTPNNKSSPSSGPTPSPRPELKAEATPFEVKAEEEISVA